MAVLRPYQEDDAQFLAQRSIAACFNEQRTGKTPTICRVLQIRDLYRKKVLIVAPKSSLPVWVEEYRRWTDAPATICVGTAQHRRDIINSWTCGALLISYDSLKVINRKDDTQTGDVVQLCNTHIDCMIIDEAHRIRGRKTATALAVFKLGKRVPNRYAITGTPAPNKPDEVWALLHFLFPSYYKSYWTFVQEYFIVTKQLNRSTMHTYWDIGALNAKGKEFMINVLPKFSTQRKRTDVMEWLQDSPPMSIKLQLTTQQKKALDELSETWETGDVVTHGVLDRLIRYRQICLDPNILGIESKSPKTTWILDYLADYPERSVIIFSKFTSYLKRLSAVIHTPHAMIIGDTPVQNRALAVKAFQERRIPIILLQIDTCKEALTLDAAEVMIFTDRYPPYGDLMQAEARFVATRPELADKISLIYYLVMENSYDEEIQTLIATRGSEVDVINNFNKYIRKENKHGNRNEIS